MSARAYRPCLALLLAMLLAIALRAYRLSSESAWCDEALTLSVLDAPSLTQYLKDAFRVDPMARMVPVYHIVQYVWSRAFGPTDAPIRWLSITLGVSCLPLLFWLTRRLFDTDAALLAVFLLAFSQVHLYQSQEVRFYALLMALSLASMAALQRALDTRHMRWWCFHGAANVLMMWTHAFVPLFFCVQGVYLFLQSRRPKKRPSRLTSPPIAHVTRGTRRILLWAAFHVAIGLAFLGWLQWLDFLVGRESHAYHLMLITWRDMANTFIIFAGGRPTRDNPAAYMPGGLSLDLLLSILFAIALTMLMWSRVRRRQVTAWGSGLGTVLFLLWTFLPFLLLYTISRVWANVLFYRYVIYCLPPACTLFAAGLLTLPGKYLRRTAVTLALLALLYQAAFLPRPYRADYRTAGRMIATNATSDTRVLALKEFNGIAVRYNTPLPEAQIETHHGLEELCASTARHLRARRPVWAVFYWWDQIGAFEERTREAVSGAHIQRHTLAGMPPLTLCELRGP